MEWKKLYCRAFQCVFSLGARCLPWRKAECISGAGSLQKVPSLLAGCDARKPLIVASRRQSQTDAFRAMTAQLTSYELFCGVTPNPRCAEAEAIARCYRAYGCDSLVAVGGGSPMDAAKAAAALIVRPDRTASQLGGLMKVRRRIPTFIAVPTTAGTGSETTIAAVVTDESHHKYAISDLCLVPRYAVLDSELTVSLSPAITAQTGMDALTHAVEAYLSCHMTTRETNMLAEQATVTVFRYLEHACRHGDDLAARQALLDASYQAGAAFTRAAVGNVHALAHTLGGLYDVPHGLANAVLLPVILRDYGPAVHRKLARMAELTGVCPAGTDGERANAFIDELLAMNRRLGIPGGFACIRSEDMPQMAAWAEAEANPTYPVPVIYGKNDFLRIIEQIRL